MRYPPVVGIVGWSGSGKTSLLCYLLAALAEQGIRVNVIKHSHHPLASDDHEKDSSRLRAAGAASVQVSSSLPPYSAPDLGFRKEPTLTELLEGLPSADLTLVEGFKLEPIPKLEIFRPALRLAALYPHDHNVIAVASDIAAPADAGKLAWLDLNQAAQVLAWLQIYIDFEGSRQA